MLQKMHPLWLSILASILLSHIEGAFVRSLTRIARQDVAPHSSPQVGLTKNASFTPFWGSNHTNPWKVLRRQLKSHCFWQHPAWLAYKMHVHKMRLGEIPERYLYWRTGMGQGIGNNIQGIESALYVAMISGRWLKLDQASGGGTLEKIFGIRNIDWRMSTLDAVEDPFNALGWYDFAHPTPAERVMRKIMADDRDFILETNAAAVAGNPFLPFNLAAIGFPNMTLLDRSFVKDDRFLPACAFHSIFSLPPRLFDLEPLPPGPRIGIHLRFGDKVFNSHPSVFTSTDDRSLGEAPRVAQQAVTCAQQLAAQMGLRSPCVVVVESDSTQAKEAAAALDGGLCEVWTSGAAPSHTFVSGDMEANYAAWARLTAVELLLVTSSTFGATAGAVGVGALDPQRVRFLPGMLPKTPDAPIACRL